ATIVFLVPGKLAARALGWRSSSATLAASVGLFAPALAAAMALHRSFTFALVLYALVAPLALPFAARARPRRPSSGTVWVALSGIVLGWLLWAVSGVVAGDGLFHLGRMRKLLEFPHLSLHRVNEFADGSLHPGYAFPLWHGVLAAIARLAGVDPSSVVAHESALLAPIALLVAHEAGVAVFRSAWLGAAAAAVQATFFALAPGHGGSYVSLALPATASRQLLAVATIALFFGFVDEPRRGTGLLLALAAMSLAFVHPTYVLFLLVLLGGFVLARMLAARRDLAAGTKGLALVVLPAAGVVAWLLPIVRQTVSFEPGSDERTRACTHYASWIAGSCTHYRLDAAVLVRGGAIAIAALALVPLACLALRRRWAALVVGGTVAILALVLVPLLFTTFSDAVSLSQSRRLAGFLPLAFALVGGISVLARLLRIAVVPAALVAGVALELAWPGDFVGAPSLDEPGIVAWLALAGGALGLVAVALSGRRPSFERAGPAALLATLLFLAPAAVHGLARWSTASAADGHALTPGLVQELRTTVPRGAIVFADLETSYRIAAYAPVYVAAAPPAHVADTGKNRPHQRRAAVLRFLRTGDLAIPRRYHAGWLVVARGGPSVKLPPVYADSRFKLYRLP
ncbi:MAG: hypothetical protein QOE29_127, partial [Gaiellaceae bacterium]|nr:hypothetical protein [Gaiellaceae bacterium]